MTRSVLVPSSLIREAEDKREATRKLGYVARAAAVFRVDRLVVFPDPSGETGRWGDGFVGTVLEYAATPPYLRKEAWDRRGELEYVGVLPPLRVRAQTGSGSQSSGSLRQGIVTEVGPDERVRVNCGLQHPISLVVPPDMEVDAGERVTVRVSSRRPVRAKLVDEPAPGFTVERATMADALARDDAGVRIAASRHGEPLAARRLPSLVEECRDGCTVVFGAPARGLPEMGLRPGEETIGEDPTGVSDPAARVDLWLNTVPNQGSEVVRTEEAMFATLAPLSLE
ncbi:MAG: putative RNA uridine N3 methyltransferase [Haloarculaceae archaeon]